MPIGETQEFPEEPLGLGAPAYPKKVDDLNEEPSSPVARLSHRCAPARRARAMKRSCPIRSSGPLGMSRMPVASTTSTPGLTAREPLVPREDFGRDEAVVGRAPRHHRRDPGPFPELQPAGVEWAEPARFRRRVRCGRMRDRNRMLDEGIGMPAWLI